MTASPLGASDDPSTETASSAHLPRLTGQAVSDLIGFTPTMLRKIEQQGFVTRGEDKLFDPAEAVQGYIRWMKDEARRSSKTEGAKRTEELRQRKLEIDIAKEMHELVDVETVEVTFTEIFTTLRLDIGSVPAGVTRDLELRTEIGTLINGAFDRCRAKFDATVAALQGGRPVLDALEDGEP